MKNYKVGIIRVLTTDNEDKLLSHQKILSKFFKQFELETKCIPSQHNGIYNNETFNNAVPKIIKIAKEWEEKLDGIIISCAEDPAVQELNKILKIPVVGAGHSAASLSINYGKKVGIIGIGKEAPLIYLKILKDNYLDYEKPKNINNTNDLRTSKGKIAIINSAKILKNKGSDVIAFACTGLSTVKSNELLKELDIPIVDGVIAEGTMILNMMIERSLRKK